MHWILIMWINGASVFAQEFNTKEACEQAQKAFECKDKFTTYRLAFCTPKGNG